MKSDIHPEYQYVVFQDVSAGTSFLTRSTISTKETVTWDDGNEYPLAKVEISSESHPFFTGTMKIVDTAGRVERFEKRYGRRKQAAGETPEATAVDTVEADADETVDTVEADTIEAVEADTAED
jgi:large subunit ribosomal protein L31